MLIIFLRKIYDFDIIIFDYDDEDIERNIYCNYRVNDVLVFFYICCKSYVVYLF